VSELLVAFSPETKLPKCSRCIKEMELVTTVPPLVDREGLYAFACPTCGRTETELIPALHALQNH